MDKSIFRKYNLTNIILLNYMVTCTVGTIILLVAMIIFKDGTTSDEYTKVFDFSYTIYKVALAVIIAPIIEEVLFRKLLYKDFFLRKTGNVKRAMIISTVIFVILHPPVRWLCIFISSICYCTVYQITNKLLYPIVLHAFNNLLGLIWEFFLLDLVMKTLEKTEVDLMVAIIISSVILIVLSIKLYKTMKIFIGRVALENII